MKVIYLDTETTGLDPVRNIVHSISGIIEIDGVVRDTFDIYVRPPEDAIIEPDALTIGHVTEEQIMQYPPMIDGYNEFISIMSRYVNRYDKQDKFHFIGYNCHFDSNFVRNFMLRNNDPYYGAWFWQGTIDVMCLANEFLKNDRPSLENFQLMTVAQKMGVVINPERFHLSMYDVEVTRDIYKIILGTPPDKPSRIYVLMDNRNSIVGCFYNEADAIRLQNTMINTIIQIKDIK
jgi:DNA polymerase-3 subunit epsilon